ncbi:putative methionyl-tRNA synthetase [Hordeum vulgare]|nr:putative methionyl-tRNA synthetase [Hordeum vulgare]
MQDKTLDTTIDMEDVECDDAVEEEVEVEEPAEMESPAKGQKNKKRSTNARPGEPRVKLTPKKDECLTEAWKTVSINLISGANQNSNTYWSRIKTTFDERKLVDPDFARIHMYRDEKAMANH